MTRPILATIVAVLVFAATACSRDRVVPARVALDADSIARARSRRVPTHVDTVFSAREEQRRFTAAVRDSTDTLRHAYRSRGALVAAFANAVSADDSTALRRLVIDVAEFGGLYYPDSRFARPPYFQKPDVFRFQISANGDHDGRTLLRRLGGRPLAISANVCPTAGEV